jgi:hypothetical protein
MPNVYIEPRPKGDPIDDYVVEDHADHVLTTYRRSTRNRMGEEERPESDDVVNCCGFRILAARQAAEWRA